MTTKQYFLKRKNHPKKYFLGLIETAEPCNLSASPFVYDTQLLEQTTSPFPKKKLFVPSHSYKQYQKKINLNQS